MKRFWATKLARGDEAVLGDEAGARIRARRCQSALDQAFS
jgi:hypothetical protein